MNEIAEHHASGDTKMLRSFLAPHFVAPELSVCARHGT